ncbi:MAG: putative ABC transporter permease subunit [Nitrospinota bacterium]
MKFDMLLKLRLKILYNQVSKDRNSKLRYLLLATFVALFVTGEYIVFSRLIRHLDNLPLDVGELLIIQLLNTLVLMIFGMLFFSNIIASLSTLYIAKDLELLCSSPITSWRLYFARLLMSISRSSWMAILFGIPIFVAYGNLYFASYWYYPAMITILIPFIIFPAVAASLIVMLLVRYAPVRQTYQILLSLGVAFIGAIVLFLRFTKPEKYFRQDIPDEMIIEYVESLKIPDLIWLPSSMLTSGLKYAAFYDWNSYFMQLGWLITYAMIALIVAYFIAKAYYLQGWANSYGSKEIMTTGNENLFYRIIDKILTPFGAMIKSHSIKDIKLFWREAGQWSQLFMLAALVAVYIFNIKNLPVETVYLKNLIAVANIGLSGVLLTAISARFVFGAVSFEGESFWIIKSAPINPFSYLIAKFFLYLIPVVVMAQIIVVVSNWLLDVDQYIMILSSIVALGLSIAMTGLGIGFGAMVPYFNYENQAEIGTTPAAMIFMMLGLLLSALTVALIAQPVRIYLLNAYLNRNLPNDMVELHFILLTLLFLLVTILSLKLGANRIMKMDL